MDQTVHEILDPLRAHRPIFATFACLMGQAFEGNANRHVGVGLKAHKGTVRDAGTVRLFVRKGERRDGDDDGPRPTSLPGEFCRSTASCPAAKPGQEHDQFCAFKHRPSHRVEPAHPLFGQRRQGRTSLRLHRVAKPEDVALRTDPEAAVVRIHGQQARGWAAAMRRGGPRTTEASDPGDDDLTAVHERP